MAAGQKIQVVSYNIHRCVGVDGRCDPQRVADVLREIEGDIIALQEVDADHWVEGGSDQLKFLAEATGFEAVEGPTMRGHRGQYGNALLTRLPLRDIRRHDLSIIGREPRGAIDVVVDANGQDLRVVTTHLGLRPMERRAQLRALVELLDTDQSRRMVLLGDMNEWLPGALRGLHSRLAAMPRLRTFPAYRPMLALDRIWVRPRDVMGDVRVHFTRNARVASDHLPLVGSIVV